MDLLSNSTFQFTVTTILTTITIFLSAASLWIGIRQFLPMQLLYETLSQEFVDLSHEEVKAISAKLHIAPDDKRIQFLTFITFKLSNAGKETIELTDATKPVLIAFRRRTILACQQIAKDPAELEYTFRLDGDKMLLVLPLIKPKESVTLRVLITGYFSGFPHTDIRQKVRIVSANNIRRSKEMVIAGIFYLFGALYMFIYGRSIPSFLIQGGIWLAFLGGLFFLLGGWVDRKSPPRHSMLPSDWLFVWLIMLVFALPVLIPLALIAVFLYSRFGSQALSDMYLLVSFLCALLGLWWGVDAAMRTFLKWRKISYNRILIGLLSTIPSLAFLALCLSVILEVFLRR